MRTLLIAFLCVFIILALLKSSAIEQYMIRKIKYSYDELPTFSHNCDITNSIRLSAGFYNFQRLKEVGFFDVLGGVNCINVAYGYNVTLYDKDNFSGKELNIDSGNTATLFKGDFDLWTMSMKIEVQPVFFSSCYFENPSCVLGIGNYTRSKIYEKMQGKSGLFAESFIIPAGYIVYFFQDDNLTIPFTFFIGPTQIPCMHVFNADEIPVSVGSIKVSRAQT